MNIFFGTDGWRALLDKEINTTSVAVVAQAFAEYVLQEGGESPSVAVGYDSRRCSGEFAAVFARVLAGNGIEVLLSDRIVPTPVLSFTVTDRHCFAGVMVTASHNPPRYNGIKFKAAYGGPFSLDQTKAVEALLYRTEPVFSPESPKTVDLIPAYVAHVESRIDFAAIRKAGVRPLVDSMGGAGGTLLQEILEKNGCPADTVYGSPSEDFSGRLPEPIASNLSPLGEALVSAPGVYAIGLATDGDADRLGVCLETGPFLSAQTTILLLVDYLKRVRRLPGAIVHTSSVTGLLRKHFLSPETPVYDVQVGFKYITDIMVRETVCFGGEESGGFGCCSWRCCPSPVSAPCRPMWKNGKRCWENRITRASMSFATVRTGPPCCPGSMPQPFLPWRDFRWSRNRRSSLPAVLSTGSNTFWRVTAAGC